MFPVLSRNRLLEGQRDPSCFSQTASTKGVGLQLVAIDRGLCGVVRGGFKLRIEHESLILLNLLLMLDIAGIAKASSYSSSD